MHTGATRHTAGSPSYLGILRLGDVHQRLRGRVDNVQELQDGGAVIRDGGFACNGFKRGN